MLVQMRSYIHTLAQHPIMHTRAATAGGAREGRYARASALPLRQTRRQALPKLLCLQLPEAALHSLG